MQFFMEFSWNVNLVKICFDIRYLYYEHYNECMKSTLSFFSRPFIFVMRLSVKHLRLHKTVGVCCYHIYLIAIDSLGKQIIQLTAMEQHG